MTDINLLPWREKHRNQQRNLFIAQVIITVIASILLLFALYFHYSNQLDRQLARNKTLQQVTNTTTNNLSKLTKVNKTHKMLTTRIAQLQALQQQRFVTVQAFNNVVDILPNGIYLHKMIRDDHKITFTGEANSNLLISQLMKKIESRKGLYTPTLSEVLTTQRGTKSIIKFQLDLTLKPKIKQPTTSKKKGH